MNNNYNLQFLVIVFLSSVAGALLADTGVQVAPHASCSSFASREQTVMRTILKGMPSAISNAVHSSGELSLDENGQVFITTTNLRQNVVAFLLDTEAMLSESPLQLCIKASAFATYLHEEVLRRMEFEGRNILNYGNIQGEVRKWLGDDLYTSAQHRFSEWLNTTNQELRAESVRLLVQGLGDASRMTEFRRRYDGLRDAEPGSADFVERLSYAEGLAYLHDGHGVAALCRAMDETSVRKSLRLRAARAALFMNQVEKVVNSSIMAEDAVVPALKIFDDIPSGYWTSPAVCRVAFSWLLKVGNKSSTYTLEEGILLSSLAGKRYPDRDTWISILGEDVAKDVVGLAKRFGLANEVRLNRVCGDLAWLVYDSAEAREWVSIAKVMVDDFSIAQLFNAMYNNSTDDELVPLRQDLMSFFIGHKKVVQGKALALIEKSMGIKYVPIRNEEEFNRRTQEIKHKMGIK